MPPTKTGKLPEAPVTDRILWLIAGPMAEAWPTVLYISFEIFKSQELNNKALKNE
jgi:hypothetical protein